MPKHTDPMAATLAENAIHDVLERLADNRGRIDTREAARAIVSQYCATIDRRDPGQRRVILRADWEVDPSVHMRPLVTAAEQG